MTLQPVDIYVSQAHYLPHLQPILDALPEDRQGHLYAPRALRRELPGAIYSHPPSSDAPLLVAGYQDLQTVRRPKVLVQHGAGQTYLDAPDNGSYSGGAGREGAGLFLCPNEQDAARNLARYPGAAAAVVGCPKLTAWADIPMPVVPTVAVSWHWPCYAAPPESGWAFQSWRDIIPGLRDHYPVLGHGHPRAKSLLVNYWALEGIEAEWDARALLDRAAVLVVDNSSLAYEWAAVGRPVVLLNDRDWRREVEHGLRFWSLLPGPDVWPDAGLAGLLTAIEAAVASPWWARERQRVSRDVYAGEVGTMACRAAEAVLAWEAAGCRNEIRYAEPRPCGC